LPKFKCQHLLLAAIGARFQKVAASFNLDTSVWALRQPEAQTQGYENIQDIVS
jgi:hypothetical protein